MLVDAQIPCARVDAAHLAILDLVLDELDTSRHVRPVVWLDAELQHVPEGSAKGVRLLREAMTTRLDGLDVREVPHEKIIRQLDETASLFHVLVIKLNLDIPYTSVFLELQCGYWEDEAEKELRRVMAENKREPND